MTRPYAVELDKIPHEMAQEEIQKQVAFLTRGIGNIRFTDGGKVLAFDAPAEAGDDLADKARALAAHVQRSLRSLQRKVLFRSASADRPEFLGDGQADGVHQLGTGQVALEGLPLRLFRYFDRTFEEFGAPWKARPVLTPILIPAAVLGKCDYFRSFPQNVTFACHLGEDAAVVEDFRSRHRERDDLDDRALEGMDTPEACLSPAVCYHVYAMNRDRTIPREGLTYGVCGKCFRYESSNMKGLRRLWDFTMREVVFVGEREDCLRHRDRAIEMVSRLLDEHKLAGEIRTASDPFFAAPDAMAKTYFQLSSETKYEISLMLPGDERLAVGSLNYHTDFFGRAFNVSVEGAGLMHSVCFAFGLERCVLAFLARHGNDPSHWPEVVKNSPELAGAND